MPSAKWCRSRPASDGQLNLRNLSGRSPRMKCSTARSSGWTVQSECNRSNRSANRMQAAQQAHFVRWFRAAAPYIHAFGGRTFFIAVGGAVVADGSFVALTHDLNLLASL